MAIPNDDAERALRKCLKGQGYTLTRRRKNGETGVDIVASKKHERVHIEVIGFNDSPPARSKQFYEVFFRAVSRIKDGATRCVIALPERFGRGLHQRAKHYGPAWTRIGDAFPELEIWLVGTDNASYERTTWSQWLV